MEISCFTRGLLMGFSIAAPVGPIGLLCIKRTLSDGFTTGLCSGLGAAMADAFFGLLAGLGVAAISSALLSAGWLLHLVGGLFLIYLGYKTCLAKPACKAAESRGSGQLAAFLSTFFLTVTNPLTIMSFAAVFAGIGGTKAPADIPTVVCLVAGVFMGSVSWWLLLSGGVSILREKISEIAFTWINRGSGLLICGFGIWSLSG